MRHDAKIGLACVLLVTGLATALCFPRCSPELGQRVLTANPAPEPDTLALGLTPIRAYPPAPAPPQIKELSESPTPVPPALPQVPLPPPMAFSAESNVPTVSVGESVSTPISPREPAEDPRQPRLYRVQVGDTLSSIAIRQLGSTQRYLEIFEVNRDRLSSPNQLKVGQELQLPPRDLIAASEFRATLQSEHDLAAAGPVERVPATQPESTRAAEASPSGERRIFR